MKDNYIQRLQLHTYIDGELTEHEAKQFEKTIAQTPELAEELDALMQQKRQIGQYYDTVKVPSFKHPKHKASKADKKSTFGFVQWLCAPNFQVALPLVFGMIFGATLLAAYLHFAHPGSLFQGPVSSHSQPAKYVIHLDSEQPAKAKQALMKASALLETSSLENIEVAIITNHHGIKLFDVNNQNRAEIEKLLSAHNNLRLFACQRALERAEKMGKKIDLLPAVVGDKLGSDEMIQRIQSGWRYIKI